jgi:hypothetical protein
MKSHVSLSFLCALATSFAMTGSALAQNWKYRDTQGRIVISDLPPPATVQDKDILERPAAPARRAAPVPAGSASGPITGGASAPLAPRTDPELDARRKKAGEEQEMKNKVQLEKEAALRADNCARAKTHIAALNDGQRMARTNDKGEREVLDDKARAEELQRARQVIASDCK